jgi:hypothetical protein
VIARRYFAGIRSYSKGIEMKSRAIALGASVIALTTAAAVPAHAADLGGLNQDLKAQTEVKVAGPAGSVDVDGSLKAPVKVAPKGTIDHLAKGDATSVAKGGGDRPGATVEANRRSGSDHSQVVFDWDGGSGVSAYADQRRKGELEIESLARTHGHRADGSASGFVRGAGMARVHGRGKLGKGGAHAARAERSIRGRVQDAAINDRLSSASRHAKHSVRLAGIGREVGNQIELSLAGWLLALAGAGFLAVTTLVRRLHRAS